MRDRSKRKYGFGDLTAPTKLECLELVEREKGGLCEAGRIDKVLPTPYFFKGGRKQRNEVLRDETRK